VPSTAPATSAQTPPVETPDPVPSTPAVAPEPPRPSYEELRVKSESVIGIRLDTALTSRTAHVEDRVSARVSRDLFVDGRVAIPAGARLEGTVTLVEHGDKFRNRARLGVKFNTIVLADKTRLPIDTETIFRDGDSPTAEATSKIGASAVVGAILGAVVGGKKGAAIGGAAGAGGGTAAVMAGGVNDAILEAGTPLTVRLNAPVTVLVEKQQNQAGA